MLTVTVQQVMDVLDLAYPPSLAQNWDSVGLVCGDPGDAVSKIMVAVDVTEDVVSEAIEWGAQLLIAHHPLLLRGVDSVAANTVKGAVVHRLITSGCALFTAHTNADAANPGVSDALAQALSLKIIRPIQPIASEGWDKWVVFVPIVATAVVREALFNAGAGRHGEYEQCSWSTKGTGQFLPRGAATPSIGSVGQLEQLAEDRIEVIAPRKKRMTVLAALQSVHPYQEPAFDVIELAQLSTQLGLGRIGVLEEPETLRNFTARVARALPQTCGGVRAAGDQDALVSTIAVCGGAGDSLLTQVKTLGVDAYVTADLRHHPVDESARGGGPAVIDVSHWASEFPWCAQVKDLVEDHFSGGSMQCTVSIARTRTDPWNIRG
ncbi:MAG: Nif3-like dinuclear metal center hexameric protein [Mycobacteriaceae bacterium]